MPERVWIPKIICRSWRHWPLECPWLHYDQDRHEHYCCYGRLTKLATTRHGSPKRRPDCPIGPMKIEDRSYRPKRPQ